MEHRDTERDDRSHAPGTPENPFTTDQVNGKARELMAPILGEARSEMLIERVHSIEDVEDIRALRPLPAA